MKDIALHETVSGQEPVATLEESAVYGPFPASLEPIGLRDTVGDTVEEASLESFPCSDAPAWTRPCGP